MAQARQFKQALSTPGHSEDFWQQYAGQLGGYDARWVGDAYNSPTYTVSTNNAAATSYTASSLVKP